MKKRVIAINLPQFHPFPENDEWWGKGFTEWTNVTRAKPRYKGHYQPHLPTDTGFYDLRLPEAREMQASMAAQYGVYGFCYYHYWFNGKQLMERPVNEILASGNPNFPFMLCWANENWARNWDGGFKNVLIEQNYCLQDDVEHIRYLCEKVFCDKRYIRVDGRPVFAVYKPYLFPDINQTIGVWRKIAKEYNMELYLTFMHTGKKTPKFFLESGFDASIDFQPHQNAVLGDDDKSWRLNFCYRLFQKLFKKRKNPFSLSFDYKEYMEYSCGHLKKNYKQFPCLTPGWDNSPRRVNKPFFMLKNNTPELFGRWLSFILKNFNPYSKEENFVFINAWNEWAEGNHLEPDIKWGRSFLEAMRESIEKDGLD